MRQFGKMISVEWEAVSRHGFKGLGKASGFPSPDAAQRFIDSVCMNVAPGTIFKIMMT